MTVEDIKAIAETLKELKEKDPHNREDYGEWYVGFNRGSILTWEIHVTRMALTIYTLAPDIFNKDQWYKDCGYERSVLVK